MSEWSEPEPLVNTTWSMIVSFPPSEFETGRYKWQVRLTKPTILGFSKTVCEDTVPFELSGDKLNGKLLAIQGGQAKTKYLAKGKPTNFEVHLHDPLKYLSNATFHYFWMVSGVNYGPSQDPEFSFVFKENKDEAVQVEVFANNSKHEGSEFIGVFKRTLSIRSEINKVNTSGDRWFKQGQLLDLNVTCDGTGPWNYCWRPVDANYNITGNERCASPIALMHQCELPIIWYFRSFGSYGVLLTLTNEVSVRHELININVYEIHKQTAFAFIFVPIGVGVLVLVLGISGAAYIYKMNGSLFMVEVADFDFTHEDNMAEKTFFERLRDSMINAFNTTSDTISHVSTASSRSVQPSAGVGIHYGSIR